MGCHEIILSTSGARPRRNVFAALTLIIVSAASPLSASTLLLTGIEPISAPVIANNRIRYKINLKFEKNPDEYWVYHDGVSDHLVIDIYGQHVRSDKAVITGTSLLGAPEIRNLSTTMSLEGLQSQIRIPLESGWHIESSRPDTQTVRIELWKDLRARELVKKPRMKPVIVYITTLAGVSAATFLLIILTNLDSRN